MELPFRVDDIRNNTKTLNSKTKSYVGRPKAE